MGENNNRRGTNSRFRFSLDGQEVVLVQKTWNLKMVNVEGVDSIADEDSDQPFSVFSCWELNSECFTKDDLQILRMFLKDYTPRRAGVAELAKSAGFRIQLEAGGRIAWTLRDFTLDNIEFGNSGRTDAFMQKWKARFRDMKEGRAA